MTKYLDQFTRVGPGQWRNEAENVSLVFDESYRRTFRAYRWRYPHHRFIVTNKNGNVMRFRSAEAAAKHLINTNHLHVIPAKQVEG